MTRSRALGFVCGIAAIVLLPSIAWAAASIGVSPTGGSASQSFTATYHSDPNGCQQGSMVEFRWDGFAGANSTGHEGTHLGSAPLQHLQQQDCSAVLANTHPPAGAAPGDHKVWAFIIDPQTQGPFASTISDPPANFRINAPSPSPSSTPSGSQSQSASPNPSASPQPTPTRSPSANPRPTGASATIFIPHGPESPGANVTVSPVSFSPVDHPAPLPPDFSERLPWAIASGVIVGILVLVVASLVAGSKWAAVAVASVVGLAALTPVAGAALDLLPGVTFTVASTRITQGLDYDIADGAFVPYDLVAGKDTLVRTRIRGENATSAGDLKSVTCHAILVARVRPDLSISSESTEIIAGGVSAVITPAKEKFGSIETTSRVWQADCWFPGYALHPPGLYQFTIDVAGRGKKTREFDLGTRGFLPTGDFRILIYPVLFPNVAVGRSETHPWDFCGDLFFDLPDTPSTGVRGVVPGGAVACKKRMPTSIYRNWDGAITETLFSAMDEFQRLMPIRSGAGFFDWGGTSPHSSGTPGLRFSVNPIVQCGGYGLDLAWPGLQTINSCDYRPAAALAVKTLNAKLAVMDAADGRRRDRFDGHIAAFPINPYDQGGQCKGGFGGIMGSNIDDRPNGLTGFLWAHELAHCLGQLAKGDPHAPSSNPAHSRTTFIPLYGGLPMVHTFLHADNPKPQSVMGIGTSGVTAAEFYFEGWQWNGLRNTLMTMKRADPSSGTYLVAAVSGGPRYVVTGSISAGRAIVTSAKETTEQLELTPDAPRSSYALVFLDARGNVLARHPLDAIGDPDSGSGLAPFLLIEDLPASAARAEIRRGNAKLWTQAFGRSIARLHDVRAVAGSASVSLSWPSAGKGVTYDVSLVTDPAHPPTLVASGLKTTRFVMPFDLLPASPTAHLSVEASNGYATSTADSDAFTIPPRPPSVSIRSPRSEDSTLYAGRTTSLHGLAFDATSGMLDGHELTWRSDRDGILGYGATLATKLSEGVHTITLIATSPSGQTASTTTRVTVRPASEAPAASPDPVTQLPTDLRVSSTAVDLGHCPTAAAKTIEVQTLRPDTVWKATSDSPWLVATKSAEGLSLRADCAGLGKGAEYTGRIMVSDRRGQYQVVSVGLSTRGNTWPRAGVYLTFAFLASAAFPVGGRRLIGRRRRGTV